MKTAKDQLQDLAEGNLSALDFAAKGNKAVFEKYNLVPFEKTIFLKRGNVYEWQNRTFTESEFNEFKNAYPDKE